MDSNTHLSVEEWSRIEKERQREADRLRVLDLARRLRSSGSAVAVISA